MYYKINGVNVDVDDEVFQIGPEILHLHREEIDTYLKNKSKLSAVKAIKEYSGLGLRNSKYVIDLYVDGILIPKPDVRDERRKKLEKLAKTPLVEELMVNLKKLDDNTIHSLLMNLTIDELFYIDELINKI